MTKKERIVWAEKTMTEIAKMDDTEKAHVLADKLLCFLVKLYGAGKVVEIFENMDKWYA